MRVPGEDWEHTRVLINSVFNKGQLAAGGSDQSQRLVKLINAHLRVSRHCSDPNGLENMFGQPAAPEQCDSVLRRNKFGQGPTTSALHPQCIVVGLLVGLHSWTTCWTALCLFILS